ncbi:hypothetical protein [Deinococcus aerophilus]|uniref:Uncharacterized protein n=1 Tax=Deinococcus aerophilus TaxID=522488 RepID=A0ABQ2GX58_9DEIO|nr:hypothetical protein [Deinococcus aerophilus]GGM18120.1 hypothetical protein GCM10010841_27860 [Deinococcus aerophilus]
MTPDLPADLPADLAAASPPVSWRTVETRVGLEDLPAFHRAFLTWRGVEGAPDMPLRCVSQRVEAELNRLVQGGVARRENGDWLLDPGTLADFPAYRALMFS